MNIDRQATCIFAWMYGVKIITYLYLQPKRKPKQPQVVQMLEKQANKPTGLKQITLPPGTVKFLTSLIEKYGDNYKVINVKNIILN